MKFSGGTQQSTDHILSSLEHKTTISDIALTVYQIYIVFDMKEYQSVES